MDKFEYNLKLDEINKLVEQEDYEDAARIADTVEWKRVRNARTLCMISEIYEASGRLEDSKDILLRAYQRSQIGRTILYRLTEVAIKMREFDEAVEYYSEFVNAAPHDNSRYILKYKIYRGRGSSLEDQISILEEYKDKEYTEKWSYELAKLYRKSGDTQRCIEACDDLVLWFRQGKYVIKALELKKSLTALSPIQQAIYDHKEEAMIEKQDEVEAILPEMEKVIMERMPSSHEEALTDNIISETQRELAQAVTQHAEEKQDIDNSDWGFDVKAFTSDTKIIPDLEEDPVPDTAFQKAVQPVSPEALQAEPVPSPFDAENLQQSLAASMHQIVSGIARRELEEDIIEPMNDNSFLDDAEDYEEEHLGLRGEETEDDGKSIDDILTSMAGVPDEAAAATERKTEKTASADGLARTAGNVADGVKGAVRLAENAAAGAGIAAGGQTMRTAQQAGGLVQEAKSVSENPARRAQSREKQADKLVQQSAEIGEKHTEVPMQETRNSLDYKGESLVSKDETPVEAIPIKDITMDLSAVVEAAAGVTHLKPEHKQEARQEPKKPVQPELTRDQQHIFSYFSSIQGLRENIAMTLDGAVRKISLDKTSKSGNIVVTGLPGSGRTTLGIRFAKALSLEKGENAARIAKIYAEDFNKKDIAATVAKIAGGTLIIEEAGDLEDEVVRQLSKAMEFRTDGLIIILEDEKRLLKPLFDKHPEFAEKFTSEVNIPIFTNDELVSFGKTYAFDEDYKIDEMATLALYNRIGELQSPDRPVTVIDVKDIVDKAIRRSERLSMRKIGKILSHKRYDDEDRIILYEKDFK